MVDKALFIDSSGARDTMRQIEMLTNNLANATTTGFRADYETIKTLSASENKNETRFYSSIDKSYSDFTPGPVTETGRDLDVAVNGPGFLVVQSKSGREGMTRAGDLQLKNSFLTTPDGNLVLVNSGVIRLPENAQRILIGQDGTVSAKVPGQVELTPVDRIRLVNPPVQQLAKGDDGLFYLPEGESIRPDHSLRVTAGSLEGSNVNAVKALVDLIEISRRFETHTNLMKEFKDSAGKANQLLNVKG